jgi:hypothetical protein
MPWTPPAGQVSRRLNPSLVFGNHHPPARAGPVSGAILRHDSEQLTEHRRNSGIRALLRLPRGPLRRVAPHFSAFFRIFRDSGRGVLSDHLGVVNRPPESTIACGRRFGCQPFQSPWDTPHRCASPALLCASPALLCASLALLAFGLEPPTSGSSMSAEVNQIEVTQETQVGLDRSFAAGSCNLA